MSVRFRIPGGRSLVAGLAVLSAFAANVYLLSSNQTQLAALAGLKGRYILSSAVLADPEQPPPDVLLDGDPATGLWNLRPPARPRPTPAADPRAWPFPGDRPFIQFEGPLSHHAGSPPETNRLNELVLWPGLQSSRANFQAYGRPRTIRLIFFRQAQVDFDREYRYPDPPAYWRELRARLPDFYGPVRISLAALPEPEASPGFPANVSQIWLRIEIEDAYPGQSAPASIGLSEIAFGTQFEAVSIPHSVVREAELLP